jgi:hypothetical protein
VFDLWLGSIESEDGALQIFQIVDFIWSWARDVYRPQIRRCLKRRASDLRGISPSSTVPFDRSQSILSDLGFQSISQTILDTAHDGNTIAHEQDTLPSFRLQDASSHSFLKWADLSLLKPWCIRHSDIVTFSFRVLEIPENEDTILHLRNDSNDQAMLILLLQLTQLYQYTFLLKRRHIMEIGTFWTGGATPMPGSSRAFDSNQMIRAFIFFQTVCQSEDWQIKREVYCIIWSSNAAELLSKVCGNPVHMNVGGYSPQLTQHSDFIRAFQQLQNLSPKQSVEYALQMISLVLLPSEGFGGGRGSTWKLPQDNWISKPMIDQYFAIFDDLSNIGNTLQLQHYQFRKILQIIRLEQASHTIAGLERMLDDVPQEDAIVVMKPSFFSQRCPRFCLFVLLDSGFDEKSKLVDLLKTELKAERVRVGSRDGVEIQQSLTNSERTILKNWLNRMSIS